MRPLPLDDGRWKTLCLRGDYVSLRSIDGTISRFKASGDPLQGPAALYPADAKRQPVRGADRRGSLSLTAAQGSEIDFKGVINGHEFEAKLRRENPDDFPLMSRGFRWISEAPYFR